jgi:aldehyde dehydrogenase (NAD(P)+)
VAPSAVDDCTVAEENFCPLVTEVVFDEPSVAGFLTAATTYANDVLWGDLAATVIVDNKTYARHRVAIEHCVAQLRYGAVALNTWTGFAFALGDTTWGAYPGDDPRGSGVGTVGNALMLCDVVKTVVRAPFRTRPRPVWFCDRANAYPALEAMINVQLAPRWWKVPRLAWRALRA